MLLYQTARPVLMHPLGGPRRPQPAEHQPTTAQAHQQPVCAPAPQPDVIVDPRRVEASIGKPLTAPSLAIIRVVQDPYIAVVPNFVTDMEVQHLLALSTGQWKHSEIDRVANGAARTAHQHGQMEKSDQHRTSDTFVLDIAQTPIVAAIEERLARLVGMPLCHLERLAMVRYAAGQYFRVHHDGRYRPWTVFLYLNDLPDGDEGETHFPGLKLRVTPRAGTAVMWPNPGPDGLEDPRLYHQGLPPRTGVKFGVNCFFNHKVIRSV